MRVVVSMIRVLHSVRVNRGGGEETGIAHGGGACSSYIPVSDLFAEFSRFELHLRQIHLLGGLRRRGVTCAMRDLTQALMVVTVVG